MSANPGDTSAQRLKNLVKFCLGKIPEWRPEHRAETQFLGTEYGGWAVIPGLIKPTDIVYSFGIGHDNSFDLEMIKRFGVTVHAFDPTPGLGDWMKEQGFDERFRFYDYGLAGFDGEVEIRSQATDQQTSGTILDRTELDVNTSGTTIVVKRLSTIMKDLGHEHIDLLKMDIEGAEFDAVADLLASGIRPKQLLIEYHRYFKDGKQKEKDSIALVRKHGYKLFDVSARAMEFGFLRMD